MPVGKNSVLLQIVISKNTKVLLKRYCKTFGLSESQYCHNVIVRSLMQDFHIQEDLKHEALQKTQAW